MKDHENEDDKLKDEVKIDFQKVQKEEDEDEENGEEDENTVNSPD